MTRLMYSRAQKRRVRVLLSLSPPDGNTRYVDQLANPAERVEVAFFSWFTALLGRYDVLHVHWPEFMIRADTPAKTQVKRVLARLLLARLRRNGTPVIRTLHNETPHEGIAAEEAWFTDALSGLVKTFIRINPVTKPPDARPVQTILHGDYVEHFAPLMKSQNHADIGVTLNVGLIRPYKGVLELIEAMDTTQVDLKLRIVGKPFNAVIKEQIETAASKRPHVFTHFGFVSDSELVDEVLRCECVLLPYHEIHNSGILLVSLSLGRPVLVTRSDTTEELQREVGHEWLQLFDGKISGSAIDKAVTHFRQTRRGAHPNFEGRDWHSVAEQHAEVYLSSAAVHKHASHDVTITKRVAT